MYTIIPTNYTHYIVVQVWSPVLSLRVDGENLKTSQGTLSRALSLRFAGSSFFIIRSGSAVVVKENEEDEEEEEEEDSWQILIGSSWNISRTTYPQNLPLPSPPHPIRIQLSASSAAPPL